MFSLTEFWAERLLTASLQGGFVLLVVWLLCSYLKQIPAITRCWLWRFAYAKLLLVFLVGPLWQIPLLPEPSAQRPGTPIAAIQIPDENVVDQSVRDFGGVENEEPDFVASSPTMLEPAERDWPSLYSWTLAILAAIWSIVVIRNFLALTLQFIQSGKWIKKSKPIQNASLLKDFRHLSAKIGLRNSVQLRSSEQVHSPMLVGLFHPTILIPNRVLKTCAHNELMLIIAHELAHARRRDLAWNLLAFAVRSFFFFHPLVRWTESRYLLDQEIACDFLALELTRLPNLQYGNMLISVATTQSSRPSPTLAAIGVAGTFQTLQKRILEMNKFEDYRSPWARYTAFSVFAVGLLAIAPIELVAQRKADKAESFQADQTVEGPKESTVIKKRNFMSTNDQRKTTKADAFGDGFDDRPRARSSQTTTKNTTKNVSVTVDDGDKVTSLRLRSIRGGKLEITFTKQENEEKDVKKYLLTDIGQLAKKNPEAARFYNQHVKSTASTSSDPLETVKSATSSSGRTVPLKRNSQRNNANRKNNFALSGAGGSSGGSSGGSGDASGSSAWESSSSISRNGVTRSTRDSGTTGDGMVGGESKKMMIEQIEKMMDKTDNPQMKETLQRMLDQINKRGR